MKIQEFQKNYYLIMKYIKKLISYYKFNEKKNLEKIINILNNGNCISNF